MFQLDIIVEKFKARPDGWNRTLDKLKANEFDPVLPVNREYEMIVYDFYVRPCYG
jgi:hypothetical protein